MDDERVHMACLLTEAGNAIAALLGGAEFELEERLVLGAYYAEVVGHCRPLVVDPLRRLRLSRDLRPSHSWP